MPLHLLPVLSSIPGSELDELLPSTSKVSQVQSHSVEASSTEAARQLLISSLSVSFPMFSGRDCVRWTHNTAQL